MSGPSNSRETQAAATGHIRLIFVYTLGSVFVRAVALVAG